MLKRSCPRPTILSFALASTSLFLQVSCSQAHNSDPHPVSQNPNAASTPDRKNQNNTDTALVASFDPPHVAGNVSSPPQLTLKLMNRSQQNQSINKDHLAISQITIDVFKNGQRVPPLPPPVPRPLSPESMIQLEPGQSYTQTVTLNSFSPPLGPGRYEIRAKNYSGSGATVELR